MMSFDHCSDAGSSHDVVAVNSANIVDVEMWVREYVA
jgi:hypothetical protein